MRRVLAALVLAAAVTLTAACAGRAAPPPGAAPGRSAATPVRSPAPQCRDAHRLIDRSTSAFTAQVDQAVAAGEHGDAKGEAAALAGIRATFAGWAAGLTALAGGAADAALKVTLTEYAGAVTATIARVHSPADLEILATFDDQELDIIADKFAAVCP
jgi:hypothetical protein